MAQAISEGHFEDLEMASQCRVGDPEDKGTTQRWNISGQQDMRETRLPHLRPLEEGN